MGRPSGHRPGVLSPERQGLGPEPREKVLGGAAQHLAGGALLHSGIVPLELDRPLLGRLFGLSASALERLTSLRELGVEGSAEELAWKLAARLSDTLSHG